MKNLTIADLKQQNLILLECISGSRAYGLENKHSDTDIKGVFYLPKSYYYGLQSDYIAQVSNKTNDEVYYELGRFVELLLKNNPTVMELLATPNDKVLYRHPLMDKLKTEWFLSKLCQHTFAGFANSQIKKARGLNKKIVNPISKEKKSVLDFCSVFIDGKSKPLKDWLEQNNFNQRQFGLAQMPHARQIYAVYQSTEHHKFTGIVQKADIITANQVSLSSIPKGMQPITYLSFNQDGYSKYCKDYSEYWQWVAQRNEERYQTTMQHGKQYDSKNMMHTIRLLQVALEIAMLGKVVVKRDNRAELLAIKAGEWEYNDLLAYADKLSEQIVTAYANCDLLEKPDSEQAVNALIEIRNELYGNG